MNRPDYGDDRLPERIWNNLHPEPNTGCWLWSASLNPDGYGKGYLPEVTPSRHLHVIVWTALVGPVPDGLELDHLCRTRHCANPAHMEPVTHAENIRRGRAGEVNGARVRERAATSTGCRRGHEWTPENTRYIRTGRLCRTCVRENARAAYVQLKADPDRYAARLRRLSEDARRRKVAP